MMGNRLAFGMAFLLAVGGAARALGGLDDLSELQGPWGIVHLERAGAEVQPQKDTTMSVSQNEFVITAGGKVIAAGELKLDAAKNPKVCVMTYTEGLTGEKGKSFKGIYKLEGRRLTICRGRFPEDPPPAEFKTTSAGGGFLVVYQKRAGS